MNAKEFARKHYRLDDFPEIEKVYLESAIHFAESYHQSKLAEMPSDEEQKKLLDLHSVGGSSDTKWKEAYKECFELFIPADKWDEASEFLSTYGSGLAKDIARKEK